MRAWRRAFHDLPCGAHMGCLIRPGEPYLELSGDGWRKVRCGQHAGETVPPVIQEEKPNTTTYKPLGLSSTRELAKTVRMGPKMLMFDHKAKQARNDDD